MRESEDFNDTMLQAANRDTLTSKEIMFFNSQRGIQKQLSDAEPKAKSTISDIMINSEVTNFRGTFNFSESKGT